MGHVGVGYVGHMRILRGDFKGIIKGELVVTVDY